MPSSSRRNAARVPPHGRGLLPHAPGLLREGAEGSGRGDRPGSLPLGPRQGRLRQGPLPRHHRRPDGLPLVVLPLPPSDGRPVRSGATREATPRTVALSRAERRRCPSAGRSEASFSLPFKSSSWLGPVTRRTSALRPRCHRRLRIAWLVGSSPPASVARKAVAVAKVAAVSAARAASNPAIPSG